jgi:ATP-binding cassette, subfamily G (WHITE), member 2, SNQ2
MAERAAYPADDSRSLHIGPVTPNPRVSGDTVTDAEAQRENVRQNNHNGLTSPVRGVSVEGAEAEFAELQRELTGLSEKSRRSRRQSIHSAHNKETDVEGAAVTDSESEEVPFDLESTLRGYKATDEESGIRSKRIGVIWEGLTVTGQGGVTNFVKTFPDAFISFFNVFETAMHIFRVGRKGRECNILKDFRGVTKPGEMVLVLGKPGSGCTTFLKVIANQRFGYSSVTGELLYGPFDAETFAKQYRGEAVYNQVCIYLWRKRWHGLTGIIGRRYPPPYPYSCANTRIRFRYQNPWEKSPWDIEEGVQGQGHYDTIAHVQH